MPDDTAPSPEATAARTELATLKADPAFGRTFASADPAVSGPARARMAELHKAAFPDVMAATPAAPAPTLQLAAGGPAPVDTAARDTARAELAAKKSDAGFIAKYLSGDAAAKAEMARLQQAAHPGDIGDGKSLQAEGRPEAAADAMDDVPASPAKYQFEYRGGEVDRALDSEARELFHGAGLPNTLAKQFFDGYEKIVAEVKKTGKAPSPVEIELGARSAEAKLQGMWGDKYPQKIEAARSVLKALPPEQYERAIAILDRTGLGNNAALIANLAAFAERRAANARKQ